MRRIRVVAYATLERNAHFVLQKRVLLEILPGSYVKRRRSATKRPIIIPHAPPNAQPTTAKRAQSPEERRNCTISPCFTMETGPRKQFYPHKYTPVCRKRQFRRRVMKLFRRNEQFYPHKYTPVCQNAVSYTHLTLPTICSV